MFGVDNIILGATIAGGATSIIGAAKTRAAQKQLLKDELAAEENRRTQMEYEALRTQRQIVRNAQMAKSIGLSNQTASGANFGSAAGGFAGQAQGQEGVQSNTVFQNLQLGEKAFDINRNIAMDKAAIGNAQGISQLGSMISGLGKPLGNIFGGPASAAAPRGAGFSSGDPFSDPGTSSQPFSSTEMFM